MPAVEILAHAQRDRLHSARVVDQGPHLEGRGLRLPPFGRAGIVGFALRGEDGRPDAVDRAVEQRAEFVECEIRRARRDVDHHGRRILDRHGLPVALLVAPRLSVFDDLPVLP